MNIFALVVFEVSVKKEPKIYYSSCNADLSFALPLLRLKFHSVTNIAFGVEIKAYVSQELFAVLDQYQHGHEAG